MQIKHVLKSLLSANSFLLGAGFLLILALAMLAGYINLTRMTEITRDIDMVTTEYSQKAISSQALHNHTKNKIKTLRNITKVYDQAEIEKIIAEYMSLAGDDKVLLDMLTHGELIPLYEQELIREIKQRLDQADLIDQQLLALVKSSQVSEVQSFMLTDWMPSEISVMDSVINLSKFYNKNMSKGAADGVSSYASVLQIQKPLLFAILMLGLVIASYVLLRNAQAEAVLTSDREDLQRRVNEHVVELNEQKEQLTVTFQSIADGVVTTDIYGSIKYLNPAAEILTGWSMGDAVGKNLVEIIKIKNEFGHNPDELGVSSMATREERFNKRKSRMQRRDGQERFIEESIAEIHDESGQLTGYVVVVRDVSERLELEKELSRQATQDELTQLYNRPEFKYQLEDALKSIECEDQNYLLCFLDLDRFKVVNDTSGHTAGDEILRQVAQLLGSTVRQRDTVARLGGDEFAFILRNCELGNGIKVMQNLVAKIELNRFTFGEEVFALGASVGVVELSSDMDAESALTQADTACYLAKESGGRSVRVYRSDSEEMSKQRGQVKWLSRVQAALDENDFELFYQPIERTGLIPDGQNLAAHYEVLVRMINKDGGYFMPGDFIPAATRYGLMPSLDRWVIKHSLRWCGLNLGLLRGARLAINIDGSSLCDAEFLGFVEQCFEDSEVDPGKVIFELTENSVIANMNAAMGFISTLKKKGCQFALDDFGTGMSSFDYLKSLPVDYLKIDGSFVKDMLNDSIDEEVVRSINAIGHAMKKYTIAEYVESAEIRKKLSQIGVNYVQGYAIAKPRPLSEMAA